jgi:hypothetical protein
MKKTKVTSVENFAQECTTDVLKMFSRSVSTNVNLIFAKAVVTKTPTGKDSNVDEAKLQRQKGRV